REGNGLKGPLPRAIGDFNELFDLELWRHASVEAQCAAVADDIAYDAHDIDDGLRAGLLTLDMLEDVPPTACILASVRARYPHLGATRAGRELVRRQITMRVEDVIVTARQRLAALARQRVEDIHDAGQPMVAFSEGLAADEKALKAFLYKNLYRNPSVMAER